MGTLRTAPDGVVEKAAWLYFADRRILFARTRGVALAYNVGGKPREGEMLEQALIREVKEETGVDLIPHTIKFYFLFVDEQCAGYVEGTKLKIYCFTADCVGTPAVQPGDTVEELLYLGVEDIGRNRTTPMGERILDYAAYQGHIGPQQE